MIWLRLHIGGQRWAVHLVSPRSKHLLDEEEELSGYCDYDTCRIYIDKSLDESAREDTLLHELLHAVMHVAGVRQLLEFNGKLEEDITSALTPTMHRLLRDLGFRFPKGLS